jgi:hypothetical protein
MSSTEVVKMFTPSHHKSISSSPAGSIDRIYYGDYSDIKRQFIGYKGHLRWPTVARKAGLVTVAKSHSKTPNPSGRRLKFAKV